MAAATFVSLIYITHIFACKKLQPLSDLIGKPKQVVYVKRPIAILFIPRI